MCYYRTLLLLPGKKTITYIVSEINLILLQGDKNVIKFDGDHNSPRPQFYYDSVSIFFYNVLRPPLIPAVLDSTKLEKYYDLGGLKVGTGKNEVIYDALSYFKGKAKKNMTISTTRKLQCQILLFSQLGFTETSVDRSYI